METCELLECKHSFINYGQYIYDFTMEKSSATGKFSLNCHEYSILTAAETASSTGNRQMRLFERKSKSAMLASASHAAILDCRILTFAETGYRLPCILIGIRGFDYCDSGLLKMFLVTADPDTTSFNLMHMGKSMKITLTDEEIKPALADGPVVYFFKRRFLYVNYIHSNSNATVFPFMIPLSDDVALAGRIVALKIEYNTTHPAELVGRLYVLVSLNELVVKAAIVQFRPKEKDFVVTWTVNIPESSAIHLNGVVAGAFMDGADEMNGKTEMKAWPSTCVVTRDSELFILGANLGVISVCSDIRVCEHARMLFCRNPAISNDCRYIVVQSIDDNANTYFVDFETFKVARTFVCSYVVVGNFRNSHVPEVLVIKNTANSLVKCEAQVISIDKDFSSEDKGVQSDETHKIEPSLAAAKQALICRSIAGRELVSRMQSQLETTSKVLDEACSVLREIAIGHGKKDSNIKKPHLLQLLDNSKGRSTLRTVHARPETPANRCCRPIAVGEPWQRVIDRQWIIGVQVNNLSTGPVYDLHLVLTSPRRSLVHSTRLFRPRRCFTSDESMEVDPPEGDVISSAQSSASDESILRPSEWAYLTTTLDIDVLQQDVELDINVLVTFRWRPTESEPPVSGCIDFHRAMLRMHDLLDNRLRVDWTATQTTSQLQCDLAALNAVNEEFRVSFVSEDTDLHGLAKCVEDRSRFVSIKKFPGVLVSTSHSEMVALENVWMQIDNVVANNKADATIHARNRSQLFVCIEYFYGILAEDVMVVPFQIEIARPTMTSAILQEINLIVNFFYCHVETLSSSVSVGSDGQQPVDIEAIRKESNDDGSAEAKPVRISITKSYREFRNKLLQLETKTDRLVSDKFMIQQ